MIYYENYEKFYTTKIWRYTVCNAWVHRICVGLSKQTYVALFEDDTPYLCPHCCMEQKSSVTKGSSANAYIDSALKQMESHYFRR